MFSNKAWDMCHLDSWQKCHDYFNHKPKPRAWKENERPLRNNRQEHYRLARDGTEYKCMLYRTSVVTWINNEEFILNIGYDSNMTRNFFPNFIPSVIPNYLHVKFGKSALLWEGMYYDIGKPFHFKRQTPPNWELISTHELITRQVLDKQKIKELRPLLTPFAQYVNGLWGIAGGECPYVGDEKEGCATLNMTYEALVREDYTTVIKLKMPTTWQMGKCVYEPISADNLIRIVREAVYRHTDAYVWKPYNER